jgi:hypothetical protein
MNIADRVAALLHGVWKKTGRFSPWERTGRRPCEGECSVAPGTRVPSERKVMSDAPLRRAIQPHASQRTSGPQVTYPRR